MGLEEIEVSKEIFDKLEQKLGGRIYVCVTKLLAPVLKVKPMSRSEYKLYKPIVKKILSRCDCWFRHVVGIESGVGLVIDRRDRGPRKLGIWKNSVIDKGVEYMINPCLSEYIVNRGIVVYKDKRLYFIKIKSRLYCSKVVDTRSGSFETRKELVKDYIKDKKLRIMEQLKERYGLKIWSRSYSEIDISWAKIKKAYKKLKRYIKKYSERVLISDGLSENNLREAGWKFYNNCQSCEPTESKIPGVYGLVIQFVRTGYWEIWHNSWNSVAKLPDWILDFNRTKQYIIDVDDFRIVKYLRKVPGLFTTKFEDIPYFKWALEKVKELLKKGGKNDGY